MFHESKYRTAKLDIEYMTAKPNEMNPMDLLSDAGMGFLRQSKQYMFIRYLYLVLEIILYPKWDYLDALSLVGPQSSHPRLAVSTVLLGDHINGFVSHFGLKCSSFSPVNVGTSGRTPCTPYGNFHYTSVLEGNCLASRKLGVFKL